MTNPIVKLNRDELESAARAGLTRRMNAIFLGQVQRWGDAAGEVWRNDVVGAIGEYAVAKHLCVFWDGAFRLGRGDVDGLEVKTTTRPELGLPVKKYDKQEASVLVSIVPGLTPGETGGMEVSLLIHGWAFVAGALDRKEWLRTAFDDGRPLPYPSTFIPLDQLQPIDCFVRPCFRTAKAP